MSNQRLLLLLGRQHAAPNGVGTKTVAGAREGLLAASWREPSPADCATGERAGASAQNLKPAVPPPNEEALGAPEVDTDDPQDLAGEGNAETPSSFLIGDGRLFLSRWSADNGGGSRFSSKAWTSRLLGVSLSGRVCRF